MPYNNMKRVVVGCRHCIGRDDDEQEVLQEMYQANPYVILLEPYRGRTKRVKMLCTRHNVVSTKTPYEVIKGKGCVQCGLEKLAQMAKVPENTYVERLNNFCPHIQLTGGYDGVRKVAHFHCNLCGSNFIDYADYVTRRGCPICDSTSVEKEIGKLLTKHNIYYKPQFSYVDCKDQRALPFDFYLPEYNVLIEYDGEQHYRPVNFGGISDEKAFENFKITQKHDTIKASYCMNNKIPLLRIPYWQKENIETIILDYIKVVNIKQND